MIHEIRLRKEHYYVDGHFWAYPANNIAAYLMVDLRATEIANLREKSVTKISGITPPNFVINYEDDGTWLIPYGAQAAFVAWMLNMEHAGWEKLFDADRIHDNWPPKYPPKYPLEDWS